MVESRFFGGLDVSETAELLKCRKRPLCETARSEGVAWALSSAPAASLLPRR